MKLYLAGSLFNEAEVNQRIKEGQILEDQFPELEVFNPIAQPFNENKASLPTAISIYENDAQAVLNCDIFLADITNNDPGVMVELGLILNKPDILIIAVNSDIRLKDANKYNIPPYSMNHFVLGAIQKYGYLVYSFEEATNLIEKHIKRL